MISYRSHLLPVRGAAPISEPMPALQTQDALLQMITAAVEAGEKFPSNNAIADALVLANNSTIPDAHIKRLEAEGKIIFFRSHRQRAALLPDGRHTKAPVGQAIPDWNRFLEKHAK